MNSKIINSGIILLVIAALIMLLQSNSFSQNLHVKDSLLQELSVANSSKKKVEIMIEISRGYNRSHQEEKYKYLEKALALSKKTNYDLGVGKSYFSIGFIFFNRGEFDIAKKYFDTASLFLMNSNDYKAIGKLYNIYGRIYTEDFKFDSARMVFEIALSYSDSANLELIRLDTYVNLGTLNFYENKYEEAEKYYRKGLKIAEQIDNKKDIAMFLSNIGNVLAIKGDLVSALDNYIKASEYFTKVEDKSGLADCLNNIGLVNLFLERFEKSILYFNESKELYLSLGAKRKYVNSFSNIGKAYVGLQEYKKAEKNLSMALRISKQINDKYQIVNSFVQLGNLYSSVGDYKKAKENYLNALEINTEYDDELIQLDCYENMAKIESKYGNLSEATTYALKALSLAKKLNYKLNIRDSYEILSKVYERTGQHKMALKYYKLYKITFDSIFNAENRNQINELETKYQTQRKQQQIELQESILAKQNAELEQSKLLRKTLVGGLIALFLIVSIVSYAYIIKRKSNIKINKQKEKIESQTEILKEANIVLQQQALSAQMNPHFMFNSLNSVQSYILKNDRIKSSEYLSKFSRLMRKVLDNSQESFITLNDEFEALNLYIEMELIRFKDSFSYNLIIPADINLSKYEIPPLIIQPFAENAIHHGLRNKKGDKNLKIEVFENANFINIIIEDNGIGRAEAQKLKKSKINAYKSYGTLITAKRIDLFKESYNHKIDLKVIDLISDNGEPTGTRIEIELR